ncbi:hypothetical protein C0989_006258, partial [Termitomyces sp. Mn162]
SNLESGGQGAPVVSQVSDETLPPVSSSKPVTPPRSEDGVLKSGSTPIRNHREVSNDIKAVAEDPDPRLVALHAEISERIVGPVDVKIFNTFFPNIQDRDAQTDFQAASHNLVSHLEAAECEENMYEHLVCVVYLKLSVANVT